MNLFVLDVNAGTCSNYTISVQNIACEGELVDVTVSGVYHLNKIPSQEYNDCRIKQGSVDINITLFEHDFPGTHDPIQGISGVWNSPGEYSDKHCVYVEYEYTFEDIKLSDWAVDGPYGEAGEGNKIEIYGISYFYNGDYTCKVPKTGGKDVEIDKTPPPQPQPKADPSGWTTDTTPNIFGYYVINPKSGVDYYEYQIDSTTGSWTSVGTATNFDVPPQSDGIHTVYVRAANKCKSGNPGYVNIYINSRMDCDCSSSDDCCDGCHWLSTNTLCNQRNPSYSCEDGHGPGSDVYRRYETGKCTSSHTCSGTYYTDWEAYRSCDSDEYCANDGNESCTECSGVCDYSCGSSACYGVDPDCTVSGGNTKCTNSGGTCSVGICEGGQECSSGACCKNGKLLPGNYAWWVCEQTGNYVYKCIDGNMAGRDVYRAEYMRYCTGTSPNCIGPLELGVWDEWDDCNENERCANDGDTSCTAVPPETCNGVDDDYDGVVDDNLIGNLCPKQQGVCTGARKQCIGGTWQSCTSSTYGVDYESVETRCDNKDNDCDGSTDEGLVRSCGVTNFGACTFGTESCSAGSWGTCNAVFPTEETCNSIDDDCDGTNDDGFTNETCQYICQNNNYTWTNNSDNLNCCGNDVNESSPYQSPETSCLDGNDNDCDGNIDLADSDCGCLPGETGLCPNQNSICQGSYETCTAQQQWPGCNDSTYLAWNSSYETSEISCSDGYDNDCDGNIDSVDNNCIICTTPTDGMNITQDTVFCTGTYNLSNGITIGTDNIVLDCNGSVLNGSESGYGIYLYNRKNDIIRNCTVRGYQRGVYLNFCDNNNITSNDVYLNTYEGIYLSNSNNNTIGDNRASYNRYYGIYMKYSSNNNIIHNNASNNERGISLIQSCSNNTVANNKAYSNTYDGIFIYHYSNNNNITSNDIYLNSNDGIYVFHESINNIITNNRISNNNNGIYLSPNSISNNIINNTVCRNTNYDIQDDDSNTGDGNTCNNTYNWNDTGTTGCTYACAGCIDDDGDGYNRTAECGGVDNIDCDDNNANVNPGKNEVCNNIDDDCDTKIDEGCYMIPLFTGWDLISFPLNLTNKSIKHVFKDVNFSSIFSYGIWYYYFDETNNNFNTINETRGYWINSLENQTLTIEGTKFSYPINFNLKQGYNLISYPTLNESNATYVFENVNNSLINVLSYENNTWYSYSPTKNNQLNTLKKLKPGYGYWVKVNNNVTWVFDGKFR